MAVSSVLFALFCAFSYSIAAYDVPQCAESAMEVTATNTVIQTNVIPITSTYLQVITATVLITSTTHAPSTVTQFDVITVVQEPVLLPRTQSVTQTRVQARSLVYKSTDFKVSFVTESHVAADVRPVYVTKHGYVTSTLQSVVVVPQEITSQINLTKQVTQRSFKTSLQYQPLYVTKTQTKSYFVTKTVYQEEITKTTVDVVETAVLTSTVYKCDPSFMDQLFGF